MQCEIRHATNLQKPNGNVALDPGNDANICLEIQLDVYLQATLDILPIEAKPCILVLVLSFLIAAGSVVSVAAESGDCIPGCVTGISNR